MFTSISRGSSRARPSYICTSCLTSILEHADAQLPSQKSDRQLFSSSAPGHARIQRVAGSGRRRSTSPISSSTKVLDALKQFLLDDLNPQRKKLKGGKTTSASTTAQEVKLTNNPEKADKGEVTEKVDDMKNMGKAGKVASAEKVKGVKKETPKQRVKATNRLEKLNKGKNAATDANDETKEAIARLQSTLAKMKKAREATGDPRNAKNTEEGKEADTGKEAEAAELLEVVNRHKKKKRTKVATKTIHTDEVNGRQEPETSMSKEVYPKEKGLAADKSQKSSSGEEVNEQKQAIRKGLAAKFTGSLAATKGTKLTVRRQRVKPYMGALGRRAAAVRKNELVRQVISCSSILPHENYNLEAHIGRAGADATREALVKVIEGGHLSPVATLDAVRDLRASLVKRIPTGPIVRRIDVAMNAYDNIKDGLQQKPKGDLVRKSLPVAFKPLQPPRSSTQSKGGRLVPKPQKAVRTGPMKGKGFDVKSITADDLHLTPIEKPQERVPSLAYGLERVLFNPGVYQLQDPRSRVFNFDPYLQSIMPVNEFDFNALKQYVTSSRDESLLGIAKEESKKYTGSTSSMTAALAHFHFLLSQWRPVNTGMLSQNFPVEYNSFTALQRGPSAIFLRRKGEVYAIDADKQYDTANILSMLGKSMEKLLTLPTSDFEKYRRQNSDQISEEERNEAETFNYTTIGDFLLRSQLDAFDPRLPGTGMFDLKTRAVVSIRMDTKEYEKGVGYEIRGRHGEWESYEREYYDMIRAAFLKYSLQVRMGRMDGIFVAFHNTERIFGFQYISLPEMDYALHGTEDTTTGDSEFKLSLELLNKVLDRATEKYPDKSIRLHFETRGEETPFMYIFAEPMEEPQIDENQASNHAAVLEFEQRVLGIGQKTEEQLLEEKKNAEWEVLRAKVEASVEKDEMGIPEARAIAEDVIQESEYWDELSPQEKEQRITELLKSFDFGETHATEQTETIVVDDGEADGEEEENDANEDGEEEEESEETLDETELEDSRGEFDLEITDEAENLMDDSNEGLDEKDDIEEDVDEPVFEESHEETDLEITEDAEMEVPDDTGRVKEDGEIEENNAEFDEAEGTEEPEQAESESLEGQESEQASNELAELLENENLLPADVETSDEGNPDTIEHASPVAPAQGNKEEKATTEVFAMTLTIRNLVNGEYVERPEKLSAKDKWAVEYALVDIAKERSQKLYESCKRRRYSALNFAKKETDSPWVNAYLANLQKLSKKGRAWRQGQDEIDAAKGVKTLVVKGEGEEGNGLWSEEKKK